MQRTLTGLKRAGTLRKWAEEQGDRLVWIYSREWSAYWRPNGSGYTASVEQAGVYTLADAIKRSGHCGPEKRIVYRFIPANHPTSEEE